MSKKKQIFYSINVTLSPVEFSRHARSIARCLQEVDKITALLHEIRMTFFLDVSMLIQLQEKYPTEYIQVQKFLHKFYKCGHDLALYINMDWQHIQDIHYLDKDTILDLFVQGKDEVIKIMHLGDSAIPSKKQKNIKAKGIKSDSNEITIRISNGKINPFVYLKDIYSFINIKLDASIPARQVVTRFYNYKKIAPGTIFRFSDDPTHTHRFGAYLMISRIVYDSTWLWHLRTCNKVKKYVQENPSVRSLFLADDNNPIDINLVHKKAFKQNHGFFLSPDMITRARFMKALNKAKISHHGVVSLESCLTGLSLISFENLEGLISNKIEFITASQIIKQFGLSTNNIVFK